MAYPFYRDGFGFDLQECATHSTLEPLQQYFPPVVSLSTPDANFSVRLGPVKGKRNEL